MEQQFKLSKIKADKSDPNQQAAVFGKGSSFGEIRNFGQSNITQTEKSID